MNESLFKRVENKTKVNKSTILDLASKLQNGNMEDKDTFINDKVPNNVDNSF